MFLKDGPLQSLLAETGFNPAADSMMVDSLAGLSPPFPEHSPDYRLPHYHTDIPTPMTQQPTPPPSNHLQHLPAMTSSNAYGMFMTSRGDDVTSCDSNEGQPQQQQQQQHGSESSPIATPETKYAHVLQHQTPYNTSLGDSLTSYMNYTASAGHKSSLGGGDSKLFK